MANIQRRSVSFSEPVEVAAVISDAGEWHTAQDRRRFRLDTVREAHRLAHEMARATDAAALKELFLQCPGLDSFFQRGGSRRRIEMRRAHIAAVLSEQARGAGDPESLRRTSERTSAWFRGKAHGTALAYADFANRSQVGGSSP